MKCVLHVSQIHMLAGHEADISNTGFNFSGDLCISGSLDGTVRLWSVEAGRCTKIFRSNVVVIIVVIWKA